MATKKSREMTFVETEKVRAPGEEGYVLLDGKTLTYVNASWVLGTEHKIWEVKEKKPGGSAHRLLEEAFPIVGGGDNTELKVNPYALKELLELLLLRDDNIAKRLEALEK